MQDSLEHETGIGHENAMTIFYQKLKTIIGALILMGMMSLLPLVNEAQALQTQNLSTLISYSEFEQLVLHTARKIPEIRQMWAIDPEARWQGGTFHRLLQWHHQQLQNHTAEDVRHMSPPDWKWLQPSGGKDIDLVTRPEFRPELMAVFGSEFEFDFITPESFSELLEIGGTTLEKAGLSKDAFFDPLNGIHAYWLGEIHFFILPWDRYRELPVVAEEDYTMTLHALRVPRILLNFPEVKLSDASLQRLREIAQEEPVEFVREEHRLEYLQIVSDKLYITLEKDPTSYFQVLRHYNLLRTLAEVGIQLPFRRDLIQLTRAVQNGHPAGFEDFSALEMTAVSEILNRSICSTAFLREIPRAIQCFMRQAARAWVPSIKAQIQKRVNLSNSKGRHTGQVAVVRTCQNLFGEQ